jgi:transcriptional regulator with XRE-family HTH domain
MKTKKRAPAHLGEAIAACVKELRAKRGMTQADIVRATGLERSYISCLEAGRITHPRISTVYKVASAFKMRLSDFIAHCEKQHAGFPLCSSDKDK